MKRRAPPPLASVATGLLVLGALLACVAVGAYVVVFAPASGFALSRADSAWSNFGSYLGGVLGPVFAALAFAGVLLTVGLQSEQLKMLRAQANQEEIQRVIANIALAIDRLLGQPSRFNTEGHDMPGSQMTIFTLISAAGTAALTSPNGWMVQLSRERLIEQSKSALATEATSIGLELEQLSWCLAEYEKCGGSATVSEYYRRRYNAVVCWLDAVGLVGSHQRLQKHFRPKEFRQFLVPEPAVSAKPNPSIERTS